VRSTYSAIRAAALDFLIVELAVGGAPAQEPHVPRHSRLTG
jgi:hypothetical protein